MGTSDLDASTFDSPGAAGNQLSCSLPFGWNRPNVKEACLDHVWFKWDGERAAGLWPCSSAVAMPVGERRERISEVPMRGKGHGRSDQAPWA